jgi:hypothetical protein
MTGEYERMLSQSGPSLGLEAGVDRVRTAALKDVRLRMAAHPCATESARACVLLLLDEQAGLSETSKQASILDELVANEAH